MTRDGSYSHDDPRQVSRPLAEHNYIGTVSEWRVMLIAFERFRRFEVFDNADALYLLSDLVLQRQTRLPAACTGQIVLNGHSETGVFLDASLLGNLAAGCRELLMMASSDRLGAFRGSLCDGWPPRYGQEPLLSDDEDRAVRRLGNRIIGLLGNHAAQLPEDRPEKRLAAA